MKPNKKEKTNIPDKPSTPKVEHDTNFNINVIKTMATDKNYLISPYSIEIALNMLKEGANNNTRKQIEDVVGTRNINNISIKNRIKIANALFVKNKYKKYIKDSFYNTIKEEYKGEILYDEFKTPDVINNWVDKNTDGMIIKILDDIDPDYVLGLANAIAIDVEWASPFDCSSTRSDKFTKIDNSIINVEMMHNSYKYSAKYIKTDDATGIILPYRSYNAKTGEEDYEEENNLEFIGILPNTDVKSYINDLTQDKLDDLYKNTRSASSTFEIYLSLPRFKYEYDAKEFKHNLMDMGITEVFDENNADLTNIISKNNDMNNIYVGNAIHKTYIDLNEKGTKAAAVTYFGVYETSAIEIEEKETVSIVFNKPFIYMIRDKKTNEILFFGTVYEPNLWTKSTCQENKKK